MSPVPDGTRPAGARPLSRRTLLRLGATAGSGVLAGCGGTTQDTPASPTGDVVPTVTGRDRSTTTDVITFDGGGAQAFADALRTAEANAGSTLEIEPGTYRLNGLETDTAYRFAHFASYGLRDVAIRANGSTFVLEDAGLGGLHVFDAENVTLTGLTIEYARPPYTRARITDVEEDARSVTVAIRPGYPTFEEGVFATHSANWATVHDPDTGDFQDSECCGGSVLRYAHARPRGGDRYRLEDVRPWRGLAVGRDLVAVVRVRQGSALQFVGARNPVVESVTVHTSPLFVALFALCAAPEVRDVTARPRPGSGRPIATTADGFHVANCHPGPTFEDCHLERLQDDAFAIDSKMTPVAELLDDRTVRLEVIGGTHIRPGDDLRAIATPYERRGSLPDVDRVETGPREGWPDDLGSPLEVAFDAPVDDALDVGDFLWNASRANAGFAIRRCESREIRARHAKITSRDGVLEGNRFGGNTSPAILVYAHPGVGFPPKGPPDDVTIRDNTITRTARNGFSTPWPGAILAWTDLERGVDGDRPPADTIRNLVVEDNEIRNVAHRGIHVADAADVVVRGNRIERPNRRERPRNAYGLGLDNVRTVRVTDNRVVGSEAALEAFGARVHTTDLSASGNAYVVDGEEDRVRFVELAEPSW